MSTQPPSTAAAATPLPSAPPVPGDPRTYHFPHCERRSVGAGTQVVVASLPRVPLVTLTAVFHSAGADADPAGREGLAELTAAMLLEGTAAMDGAALAEYFEGLGSSLSASADWDATMVSFTVQPARLDTAVRALREVLRRPAFPERQLARLRAEHAAGRLQLISEPRSLANTAFGATCYDAGSRYRRSIDGPAAAVGAVVRDDLMAFWKTRYAPSALTVVFAGDIAAERALAAAQTLIDGWDVPAPPAIHIHTAQRFSAETITLVEKPGAAQAELRVGHIGVPRLHDAFFSLTVMNAVLGGLFSSRINLNLREQHGYTYGASSGFDWRTDAGPWLVSTAVANEVAGAAVREIRSEIDRMRTGDITADELALASSFLVGVFPLRFETTMAVAGALAAQATFGLPDDYFDTYRARIAAVGIHDVRRAAEQYLLPDRLQIVAVGEPIPLREQLSALTSSEIRVTTPEEVEAA